MKGIPTPVIILVVIAAIAIGLWLEKVIAKAWNRNKANKTMAGAHPILESAGPVLKHPRVAMAELENSVNSSTTEFGNQARTDNLLNAVALATYPPSELASAMAARGDKASDIATMLAMGGNLDLTQIADIVMPLTKGTTAERAAETFIAIKEAVEPKDDDDELIQLPVHLGCSVGESAQILYDNTDLLLGSILRKLYLYAPRDITAKIAKELDIDLSETSEYESLRKDDDGLSFEVVASILKACGKDTETIISAENEYQTFDEESDGFSVDEMEQIFSALSKAGFTNTEIMTGLSESGLAGDNPLAAIIRGASDNGVAMKDIIAFLKTEDPNADDLDDEMRELEFEVRTRVDILHAFLHTKVQSASEVEADPSTVEETAQSNQ
jgi:hypothetical protein